jgi:hypothetical protein
MRLPSSQQLIQYPALISHHQILPHCQSLNLASSPNPLHPPVNAPSLQTPKLLIAKKKREPKIRDWLLAPPAARQKNRSTNWTMGVRKQRPDPTRTTYRSVIFGSSFFYI